MQKVFQVKIAKMNLHSNEREAQDTGTDTIKQMKNYYSFPFLNIKREKKKKKRTVCKLYKKAIYLLLANVLFLHFLQSQSAKQL